MKKIKTLLLLLVVVISAFAFTACSADGDNVDEEAIQDGTSIVIEHELGTTTLEQKPERVVVFDYGILDAMDKMGEDIVGLPKGQLPPYLDKYDSEEYIDVGTLKEANFETIYELQPDLIIISTRQAPSYEQFEEIAPTVVLTIDGGDYMNTFKSNMDVLGQIFGKEDILVGEMETIQTAIDELYEQASTNGKNALFIMANDGGLSAYGIGSRFGILYNEFALTPADPNIDASTHGQKITFEYIVETDPDYLFVMDRATIAGGETTAEQTLDNELIKSTKAYENGNITYLDPYIWYVSSGGLTGTMEMVEEVQAALNN